MSDGRNGAELAQKTNSKMYVAILEHLLFGSKPKLLFVRPDGNHNVFQAVFLPVLVLQQCIIRPRVRRQENNMLQ